MLTARFVVGIASLVAMALGATAVCGQTYPNKSIRMVASEPGGAGDVVARMIAQGISEPLGQQVLVDNRPSGVVFAEIVAKAPPDGYTLLVTGNNFWLTPFMQDNVPYDPVKDFLPITLAVMSPLLLVVHPSVPVQSVKELIVMAKARPGELNYGSAASGSTSHLATELFKSVAGVDIVRIPYRGLGPAINALVGGQLQLVLSNAASVTAQVKAGRLKALAVTSAQPSALAPGLPTVAASGLPGYEWVSPFGMFAPIKTPATIINRLNQEMVRFLKTAEVKEKFFNTGAETVGSSPDEFAARIKSEMAKSGKLIRDLGIREK